VCFCPSLCEQILRLAVQECLNCKVLNLRSLKTYKYSCILVLIYKGPNVPNGLLKWKTNFSCHQSWQQTSPVTNRENKLLLSPIVTTNFSCHQSWKQTSPATNRDNKLLLSPIVTTNFSCHQSWKQTSPVTNRENKLLLSPIVKTNFSCHQSW